MSENESHRASLVVEYMQSLRKIMRMSIDWMNTVALALGVHPTDLTACSYLYETGPMTAGELARALGLTTGAMTAAIDRLERAGFAKRKPDPLDRRKVVIAPANIPKAFIAMREEAMRKIIPVFAGYSDAEASRIVTSMQELADVFAREIPNFNKSLQKHNYQRRQRKKSFG